MVVDPEMRAIFVSATILEVQFKPFVGRQTCFVVIYPSIHIFLYS